MVLADLVRIQKKTTGSIGIIVAMLVLTIGMVAPVAVHAADPGTIGEWTTEENSLPQAQNQFAAVQANGFIYTMGGSTAGDNEGVFYAPIESDGSVGTWIDSPNDLPNANFRMTAATYNNYIYVIGGRDGGALTAVLSAPIDPETGAVGEWTTEANALPHPLYYASSFVHEGYVYVVGGDDNSQAVDTVYSAQLNEDGSVGAWVLSDNLLPQEINMASTVTFEGYAYNIGGFTYGANASINNVYSAPLGSGGVIGAWTELDNSLPEPIRGASAIVFQGYVFLIGGFDSDGVTNSVYSAQLLENGEIGEWTLSDEPVPQPLEFPSTVSDGNRVYVLGGTVGGFGFVDTIYSNRVAGDPKASPLCEWPSVTATAVTLNCVMQAEEGGDMGVTTWQARYRKAGAADWTPLQIPNPLVGSITVNGLDPSTDYQISLKATNNLFDNWLVEDVTTLATSSDVDGDGTRDVTENNGPNNGDANNDGILDATQANVVSFVNGLTGKAVAIELNEACSITSSTASQPATQDVSFTYPNALLHFVANCGTPGFATSVKQFFYDVTATGQTARKFNSITGQYSTIVGASISQATIANQTVTTMTYDVIDGGSLDEDGQANGVIVDPAGLGIASGKLANTGTNTAVITGLSLLLMATGAGLATKTLKQNS